MELREAGQTTPEQHAEDDILTRIYRMWYNKIKGATNSQPNTRRNQEMTTAQIEVMDLAREMGFEHWLGLESNRGWFTCQITGKKFRGEVAMEMLNEQAEAMNERQAEIEQAEEIEEINYEEKEIEEIEANLKGEEIAKCGFCGEEMAGAKTRNAGGYEILDHHHDCEREIHEGRDIESAEAAEEAEQENADFAATISGKRTGVIKVNEEKITEKLAVHLEIKMVEGKPVKMTTIECEDCGKERQIKVQDAFQVTRCPECQKKHRNKKRAERRRQQRAEAKAAAEQAE